MMTPDDFVKALTIVVEKTSIEDVIGSLEKPPGRRPKAELIEISDWYKSQSLDNQQQIRKLISESVKTTLFGFLCVIDGVRKISDVDGSLELKFVAEMDGTVSSIKEGCFGDLHDIYNASN